MASIVVDGVTSTDDVWTLVRHLLDCLASNGAEALVAPDSVVHLNFGPTPISDADLASIVDLDDDYSCTDSLHREGCSCRYDAAHTDPRQGRLIEPISAPGPVPYVPCSKQGQHLALTECWMCWGDVHRGAVPLEHVLAS